MKYMERVLERKFLRMSSFFKAVLVTGARQVDMNFNINQKKRSAMAAFFCRD